MVDTPGADRRWKTAQSLALGALNRMVDEGVEHQHAVELMLQAMMALALNFGPNEGKAFVAAMLEAQAAIASKAAAERIATLNTHYADRSRAWSQEIRTRSVLLQQAQKAEPEGPTQ